MAVQKELISDSEFEAFIRLEENAERRFEWIDGEIIEVPSNAFSSQIAILIASALLAFVRPRRLGHITGEGGGYLVGGRKLSPDVAYVAAVRQAELAHEGYNAVAPDLVVEVVSPTDRQPAIRRKLAIYSQAGVPVWLVYPERQVVEVYFPDQPVEIVEIEGALDGKDVLPGFSLPLRDIFSA